MAQDANHPVPTISTHVLDTGRGMPAAGVHVTLYRIADDGRPFRLTQALTDADGRVADLLDRPLTAGDYRLEFALTHELDDAAPGAPPPTDRFFRRLTGLFTWGARDRDMDQEMAFHVDSMTREYVRSGMSEAEAARAAAMFLVWDEVDEWGAQSFPASDPPANW